MAKKQKKSKSSGSGFLSYLTKVEGSFDRKLEWKRIFFIAFGISSILLFFASTQAGVNGDENVQVAYSENALDFYATYGADTSVLQSEKGPAIRYYGGGFEIPAGLVNQALGFEPTERAYHHVRHILIAFLGMICLLAAGLIGKLLTNWRGATIAVAILALSPRFFGHAVMNPKDIPFAAGYILSLLFMLLIIRSLPKVKWRDVIGLIIAMGYVLSVRSGGLLVFIYFAMFFIGYWLLQRFNNGQIKLDFTKLGKAFVLPIVAGFALGILLWPFGLLSPFAHTYESISTFANFPVSIRVLFSGEMVMSTDIPFRYLFTWIIYTIPPAFFLGLVVFLLTLNISIKKSPTFLLLCTLFTFLFPLFYVLYKDSPLYDGWRQFNFVYVAAVPIAAVAWESLAHWMQQKNWKPWITIGIVGLLLLEPAIHIARNFSYPYVYFNPFVGGEDAAFGEFELDYWGISTRQAIEALEEEGILKAPMDSSITIASNFSYSTRVWLKNEYKDSVTVRFSRYRERYDMDWDYAIYVSRFMDGTHMQAIKWPGSNRVVKTLDVNNTPITAIYKKTHNYAFEAQKAMNSGNVQKAIELFNREIAFDPKNEIAYNYLGQIYMNQGNLQQAIRYFEQARSMAPDDQQVNVNLALAYANTDQVPKANNILLEMVEKDERNYIAYYYLALISSNTNDVSIAARYIEKSIQANPGFRQAYVLASSIYRKMGDNARASYFENIANQLK